MLDLDLTRQPSSLALRAADLAMEEQPLLTELDAAIARERSADRLVERLQQLREQFASDPDSQDALSTVVSAFRHRAARRRGERADAVSRLQEHRRQAEKRVLAGELKGDRP